MSTRRSERFSRLAGHSVTALIIGFATAVGVFLASLVVDDRRSMRESTESAELTWRQILIPGASLPGADLDGLDLKAVYAPGADLSGSSLRDSNLEEAVLTGSILDGSDLSGASLVGASASRVSWRGVDLTGVDLDGANLSYGSFRFATLEGTNLEGADIWKADLRGVDLGTATLPLDDLDRACWDEHTIFPDDLDVPDWSVCEPDPAPGPGGLAEHWAIDLLVARSAGSESRSNWADTIELGCGESQLSLLARFDNLGRTPVDSVKVLFDFGSTGERDPLMVQSDSVRLFNSASGAEGFLYGSNVVQAGGSQVNVNAGSYSGRSNLYVQLDVHITEPRPLPGAFQVEVFATPEGRGTIRDTVGISYAVDCE